MAKVLIKLFVLAVLLIVDCSSDIHHQNDATKSRNQPPSPFDRTYQMIILTGGQVYGILNKNATKKQHVSEVQHVDIVISAGKILALIEPAKTNVFVSFLRKENWQILTVNVNDQVIIPGLIDPHIHAIGGGGEQGPYSRTAESRLSELINGGLTTVVGILGTDGLTRSLSALLQKMKGLEYDGLSTWMWVGSYRIPIVTLTGSFQQDLVFIDKVLGAGELALSDHRSSWPSKADLLEILSDARVNGMLSGKPGLVHFHMGSSPTKLDLLWQILNETTIPIRHMYPTHMTSRGQPLIDEARKWLLAGGTCDFTADLEQLNETDTVETLNHFRNEKLPLQQITVSSDAYGSVPVYDASGHLISYGMAPPDLGLKTIQTLVFKYKWPLDEAIQFSTSNPAVYLNLNQKGFLSENYDADIVVLNRTDLSPLYVFGKGQVLKTPSWTKHDMFEPIN